MPKENQVVTNTFRTQLLMNGEPLPWTDWAGEFREAMPDEINALMEAISAKSSGADHSKSIRDRLKALMDLYKVSQYRPTPDGSLQIADSQPTAGGNPPGRALTSTGSGNQTGVRSNRGGNVGGVYSTFLKSGGQAGTRL